jgi:hypothetical protein
MLYSLPGDTAGANGIQLRGRKVPTGGLHWGHSSSLSWPGQGLLEKVFCTCLQSALDSVVGERNVVSVSGNAAVRSVLRRLPNGVGDTASSKLATEDTCVSCRHQHVAHLPDKHAGAVQL